MKRHLWMPRTVAIMLVLLVGIVEPMYLMGVEKTRVPELPQPSGFDMFSQQQEIEVGQQNAAEVMKQLPVLPDSNPVSQYVQQLGRKLVSVMPQPAWPYQFHVVQQKDINAFALPGGPIFVNIGTLNAADNEAALAGVIAHEMSHVYMRHSTKMASKQVLAQVPLSVIGGMLGGGVGGQLARLGISFGLGSYFLKYSRSDEAQADTVGAIIMYKAGYNPVEMANFFKKLEEQSGGGSNGPQFLSDHPNPGNRIASVEKDIKNWAPRNYQQSSSQFQRAKQQAAGIKAYSAQEVAQRAKQGGTGSQSGGEISNVSTSAVAPSGSFETLEHQAFTIAYPNNWQVYGDRNSAVTIAPQAGISQSAVAYGTIITDFHPENTNSLDTATQQLIESLRQANPDLRAVGSSQKIKVNGQQGRSVELAGTSPIQENGKPLSERDWLVALPRNDGSLMYMVFIAPERDFTKLRPTFEQMLRSMKFK